MMSHNIISKGHYFIGHNVNRFVESVTYVCDSSRKNNLLCVNISHKMCNYYLRLLGISVKSY